MTQFEQTEAWSRQRDQLRQVAHNFGSRVQYEDSHGSSQASSSFPCPSTMHGPTSQFFPSAATAFGHTGMFRGTAPVGGPYPGMVPGPQIPAYTGFYPDAGAGPSSSSFRPDNETFTLDDFDSLSPEEPAAQGDPDVLGYSQLGGAPLGISQQQTPQPLARPERQVRSPDVLTYSEGHVRAQQRAKRVRRPRGG